MWGIGKFLVFNLSFTTGTTTNAMLDGIPTTNAYTDTIAVSVGYAIQSGVVLARSGNYWYRIGTSTAVDSSLTNQATTNIVPIGTTSKTYWASRNCSTSWSQASKATGQYIPTDAAIASCTYNAATGLYYDGGNTQRNWTNASSLCIGKGMRLPTWYETAAKIAGGIPSYTNYTWTSTVDSPGSHYLWVGTNSGNYWDTSNQYVRCVVTP